jgi:hypothetical protein
MVFKTIVVPLVCVALLLIVKFQEVGAFVSIKIDLHLRSDSFQSISFQYISRFLLQSPTLTVCDTALVQGTHELNHKPICPYLICDHAGHIILLSITTELVEYCAHEFIKNQGE